MSCRFTPAGNWDNAANWSTNPVVRDNGGGIYYNAVIDGTGSLHVSAHLTEDRAGGMYAQT